MSFVYQRYEPRRIHMGIYLGRRNIGMTEQCLQDPKVRPARQQMGCKGVAQDMRTDLARIQLGPHGQRFYQLIKPDSGDVTRSRREKEDRSIRLAHGLSLIHI